MAASAHSIVSYSLLAFAIAMPCVVVSFVFFVNVWRRVWAEKNVADEVGNEDGENDGSVASNAASVAYPHFTGAFRLAVARGDYDQVVQLAEKWQCGGAGRSRRKLRALLNAGPHGDYSGFSSIHVAAIEGHVRILEFLLCQGVNPNRMHLHSHFKAYSHLTHQERAPGGPGIGRTALHYATHNNHIPCVGILVRYGADYSLRDGFGEAPVDVAIRKGYNHIANLLIHIDHLRRAQSHMYMSQESSRGGNTNTIDEHSKRYSIQSDESNSSTLTTLAALAAGNVTKCNEEEKIGSRKRTKSTHSLITQLLMTTTILKESIATLTKTSRHSTDDRDASVHEKESEAGLSKADSGVEIAPLFLYFASALNEVGKAEDADSCTKRSEMKDVSVPRELDEKDSKSCGPFEINDGVALELPGYDGYGSAGTKLLKGTIIFRYRLLILYGSIVVQHLSCQGDKNMLY